MQYHEFIRQVKERAQVETEREALMAIRATLHTLVDHMAGNAPDNLAAQLPAEFSVMIRERGPEQLNQGERFPLEEFYRRVAGREEVDPDTAVRHAHVVMEVLGEAVTEGELSKVRKQLPPDYAELFQGIHGAPNA